jgi:large subunit ribosomal protein L30
MSTMLRITQVGSPIGRTEDQRATVRSLGLRRIRHTVLQPDRPEIRGMLRKVAHLVTFEEISAAEADAFRAEAEARRTPKAVPTGPRAKDVARAAWKGALADKAAKAAKSAKADEDASRTTSRPRSAKKAAKKTAAKKAPAKKPAAKKAPAKKVGGEEGSGQEDSPPRRLRPRRAPPRSRRADVTIKLHHLKPAEGATTATQARRPW